MLGSGTGAVSRKCFWCQVLKDEWPILSRIVAIPHDRPEPLGRGREPAFHQPIDGAAGQPGIEHRVALPDPERLQVEQLGADLAVEHLGVDRLVEREPRAVERLEAAELVLQFDDPLRDMRTGRVF